MEKQELQQYIDSLGIVYSAHFVPQSVSRNAKEKPCLNWLINLHKDGNGFTTDYMQGIGHLPKYKHNDKSMHYARAVNEACEKGMWGSSVMEYAIRAKVKAPLLIDVLYSLVQDASVLDYSTFESWADDFGYDHDSRSAEKTYRACLEIGLKMRNMLGDSTLQALREAYQDY